jgi:hypothetical protein
VKPTCGFLVLALVAADTPAILAQSPSGGDDIVVLGRKVEGVAVQTKLKIRNGVRTLSFRIVKSSGDADVDNLVLQASNECGAQTLPRSGKVDQAEFRKAMNACARPRINDLVEALYERRNEASE